MSKSDQRAWLTKDLSAKAVSGITIAIGILVTWLFGQYGPLFFQTLSKTALWSLIGLLIVLCTIFGVLLYINYNPIKKAFGLLWDKRLNAHCPACGIQTGMPVAGKGYHDTVPSVECYCPKCQFPHYPKKRDGAVFQSVPELMEAVETETGWSI